MKKIAITGHTRGIGKALVERLDKRDYEIKGFSQSTGYNLQRVSTVKKVVNECLEWDADVLVNNAGTNIPEPFEKIKQKSFLQKNIK